MLLCLLERGGSVGLVPSCHADRVLGECFRPVAVGGVGEGLSCLIRKVSCSHCIALIPFPPPAPLQNSSYFSALPLSDFSSPRSSQ
ncbi:hypothetical protein EJB05_33464, partial [Eragrostis curvula]